MKGRSGLPHMALSSVQFQASPRRSQPRRASAPHRATSTAGLALAGTRLAEAEVAPRHTHTQRSAGASSAAHTAGDRCSRTCGCPLEAPPGLTRSCSLCRLVSCVPIRAAWSSDIMPCVRPLSVLQ